MSIHILKNQGALAPSHIMEASKPCVMLLLKLHLIELEREQLIFKILLANLLISEFL